MAFQTINFNFFQLLILFGSIQGIVFSGIVFSVKKYQSKSVFFLALTVLFLSLSNIQHMLIDINYFTKTSVIRNLYIPWQWLVGSMFYFFAHYFLKKEKMSHKLLIFLIAPFFVVSLIHLCQLIYQAKFNVNHTIADYYEKGLFLYTNLISFIYIPVIVYKMYTMITSYENNAKNVIQKVQEETRWLKQLIHIGIGIVTLGMISVVYILITQAHTSFVAYPFFISLSIWIYWVGYIGINKSSSHKKLEILAKNQMSKKIGHPTFIKINEHILREKKYLVQDIGLTTIASHFDLSSGYLSQLINRHTKKSFNDYINELRIKAAKRMLSDIRYNNYTIESIGLECGFKSKSNFYTSFKKFSGQTPNQYKKHQKISSGS